MPTASDVIKRALRLIGQLAEGELPSNETNADALESLNDLLDSWSTDDRAVFHEQDQSFSWASGSASKTLGPSGDFVGNRPVEITSAYFVLNNINYPLQLITRQQYNAFPLPATQGTPFFLFVDMDVPDVTLHLYPVPSSTITFHAVSVEELSQPATLATSLVFPPGYKRMFAAHLAMELAPEFGVDPPQRVIDMAIKSKSNIERKNMSHDELPMPGMMLSRGFVYDINSDR